MKAVAPLWQVQKSAAYAKAKRARTVCMDQAMQLDAGIIDVKGFSASRLVLNAMFAAMDSLANTAHEKVLFKEVSP